MKLEVKRLSMVLSLIMVVAITGCSSTSIRSDRASRLAADANNTGTQTKEPLIIVEADDYQLKNRTTKGTLYTSTHEIEDVAYATPWLIWTEDDVAELKLAQYNGEQNELSIKTLPPLGHDADILCWAQLEDNFYDLFVHDGDAFFYHYWVNSDTQSVQLVRKLATNPDIETCALTDTSLVFSDPFLGALTLARSPETDAITRKANRAALKALKKADGDSIVIDTTANLPRRDFANVHPSLETEPVTDTGDAADDPVILVSGDSTWIVGTNKKRGLAAYDLSGKQVHFSARGRINNVDAIELANGDFILAASNRTHKTIDLYKANPANDQFSFQSSIALTMDDPYGLCMGQIQDTISVFVGDSEGLVEHWQLDKNLEAGDKLQAFDFSSQTEGCVFDKQTGLLYIGQEETGIWQFNVQTGNRQLMEAITVGNLVADVEGMDIYYGEDRKLMVVSSQGEDAYVVYQVAPWKMVAKFTITANLKANVDGASETDGLAVTNRALPGFPMGVLVVQDGRNRAPVTAQSFKVVDWQVIDKITQ